MGSENREPGLDFAMLGTLQVGRSGASLRLGGRQQRAVLAYLLTEVGSTVSVDRLADALWGDAPPPGHVSTLRTYVFHLREVLEPGRARGAPGTLLVSGAGGYRLDLGGSATDAARFEALLARGQASLSKEEWDEAASTLREALELWRGPVLADLAAFAFVAPVAARLEELRLTAQQSLVAAYMDGGRHDKAIADLDRLVAENPLRERLHGQRMLALYRAGRQSESLNAYRELRSLLSEEMGIEPSPEIRGLHRKILTQDPGLAWRPPEQERVVPKGTADRAAPRVPEQRRVTRGPVRFVGDRPGHGLAGRAIEVQLLGRALEATMDGDPSALVVHGEAGVGKTRLVRDVSEDFRGRGFQVLWGTCVRFGQASCPYAPVAGALQGWLAQIDAVERHEVLSGAEGLGMLLPGMGNGQATDSGQLLRLIDMVLERIAERRPTILVVDDLQWADASSLDLLAYLVTGFRQQRLTLLATCRDEDRPEGHPLHGWLADMRRMTGFGEVNLDRLDLEATESQLAGLLGGVPDVAFAAEVQERTNGNPYLTELLVGSISDDSGLPQAAPPALRDALLAKWHGLSGSARRASRVLAVAGRPTAYPVLAAVSAEHGVDPIALSGCLTEAREQGVVQPDQEERQWFRHPLLAEVLYEAMPPGEARRVHSTYVRVLEASAGTSPGSVAADLALHNERAGCDDETFRWSVVAADHAAGLHASAEESAHLERACALWERVSPQIRGSADERIELLLRGCKADGRAGRVEAAIVLVEQAIDLVSREEQPLLASTLLRICSDLSWERWSPATAADKKRIEAVELTSAFPDSPERALALASLATAEAWDGSPRAAEHAEAAVQVAGRSGSPQALAAALGARSMVHVDKAESTSLADAEGAARCARSCGDSKALGEASIWRVNRLWNLDRVSEGTAVALEAFDEVREAGSTQWAYFLGAQAAKGLLFLGRWDECRALLRSALASRCGGISGAFLRLVAAQLAVRSGNVAQSQQHFKRALELVSTDFEGLREDLAATGVEVLVASGEPSKGFEWVRSRVGGKDGWAGHDEDVLVPLANAAAEIAQAARQSGDRDGAAQAIILLDEVVDNLPEEPFVTSKSQHAWQQMQKTLFNAEVSRCRGASDQAVRWEHARQACGVLRAHWHESVSALRCGEALLADGSPVSTIGEPLRRAHHFAVEVGADSLRAEIESLARAARIDLSEPVSV